MVVEELKPIFDAEFDQPDPEPEIVATSANPLVQNGPGGVQRLRPLVRSFPWDEPMQGRSPPSRIFDKPTSPLHAAHERKSIATAVEPRGYKSLVQVFDSLQGTDALRVITVAVLTILCSVNMICLTAAKQANGKDSFNFEYVTVTLAQETCKFFVAASCFQCEMWYGTTSMSSQLTISSLKNFNFLQYGIPGLLYCFDNNFQYVILGFLQPAELTILWNFKIFATTLLLHAFLNRRYSQRQWASMALLVFACAATQGSDLLAKHSQDKVLSLAHEADHMPRAAADFPDADPGAFSGMLPQEQPSKIVGMGLALFGSSIAASGNVFCEYLVKDRLEDSIHLQNMQLYFFGILLNLATLFVKALTDADSPIHGPDGFFTGYNGWVWIVICISAIHGIVISATLKYVDNIAVIFAHALSMVVVAVVSAEFFGLALSVSFVLGGILVLVALWMFYSEDQDTPERRPSYVDMASKPILSGAPSHHNPGRMHTGTDCPMYCLDGGF